MTEKYDALIEQVADRLCIYWGPGDPLSISEERLVAIIDLVRADERKRIREALADTEIGGPVHRAMSMWTSTCMGRTVPWSTRYTIRCVAYSSLPGWCHAR